MMVSSRFLLMLWICVSQFCFVGGYNPLRGNMLCVVFHVKIPRSLFYCDALLVFKEVLNRSRLSFCCCRVLQIDPD